MHTISATQARGHFHQLMSDTSDKDDAIVITNRRSNRNVGVISERRWKSIEETLRLSSVPGLVESVRESEKEDVARVRAYDPGETW